MLIGITILNWEKFNPRSDRANYSWFRMQNTFFSDQAIFGLPDPVQLLFMFLCCEASKCNTGQIALRLDYISAIRRRSEEDIRKDIEILSGAGLISVELASSSRHEAVIDPSLLPATNDTNDTNDTNERNTKEPVQRKRRTKAIVSDFDLEAAYQKYPRQEKKTKGLQTLARDIQTQEDYDSLLKAVENYSKAKIGTQQKYLMVFSTFANEWRDWVLIQPTLIENRQPDVVQSVIDAISKFSSGRHLHGIEWESYKARIQAYVGAEAWKLITAMGGWQKIHDRAPNPISLRSELRERAAS